jgi:hypothetical protein
MGILVTMMGQMEKPSFEILLLCVAVFTLAAAVAWGVFEAMPHLEDEHANLFQAKVFARGRVVNPLPPVPLAFYVPYIIDHDDHQFAKYPPGYPLLLGLGVLVRQPWLVNAIAAALALLGVYLLGRDLFDHATGLLAAALGAVSPMFVMLSGTLLSHPTSLAALTFFAWAFVRARRPAEPRRNSFAWAAGALGGLALVIRPWTALGIGLPFVIVALADLLRRRGPAVAVYGRMVLAFVAVGSVWPLYNLVATGSALTNTYTMVWAYDRPGFGPDIGSQGYDWSDAMRHLQISFGQFDEGLAGWPGVWRLPLVWLVIALGILLPPRKLAEPLLLIPPALLVAGHLLFWASSAGLYGPRYYAEGMPFLWLLAARGLLKASAWRPGRTLVKVGLTVCIAWGVIFVTGPRLLAGRGLYDITREDVRQIASAGIHHALVFVQTDYWTDYARLSWLNAADLEAGDNIFAKDLDPETNQHVTSSFPGREVRYYDRHRLDPFVSPVASP